MDVAVVGSLNLDTTVRVPRLPELGETVLGSDHFVDTGGKGANQAVAVARLGRSVAMIGMLGEDDAGMRLRRVLDAEGVDTRGVGTSVSAPTGIAVITVDDAGENTIVVDPGANATLTPKHLSSFEEMVAGAQVVLAQLEVPVDAVFEAARLTTGRFLLNPAPARELPTDLLELVDVLVPNASELAALTGEEISSGVSAARGMAESLEGPKAVVVTLGARGAIIVDRGRFVAHVPSPSVDAVDPTAAGDAFCGGLADRLAGGASLEEAVAFAVKCGALTATRLGAQSALPTREEVDAMEAT